MAFCTCKGIHLYYEDHGKGSPLLLVSGLSGGSWSWYGQVPFFEKHYRTIVFDNRGAGRSDTPEGPYTMRQFAEDALCLLDAAHVEQAFVLGLSMGGMIAQELALLAPHRVRALVLGCTHCGGTLRIPPSREAMEALINNAGLSQEQIVDKNLPFFFSDSCRHDHPEVISRYRNVQLNAPLQPEQAFHAQLAAIGSFDACGRISEIQAPTLIIAGTEDALVPFENARILAERIPHANLVRIPGAGHAIHAECRDDLNVLAHDFFGQH